MIGPVEYLTAAHARAEEAARAATPGPWTAHRYGFDAEGFDASIGHHYEADVVGAGYEGGGVVNWPDAVFIAMHDPATVLRRIEAERKILAEHGPDAFDPDHCPVCISKRPAHSECWDPDDSPCDTVRALAEAWGWTEEQR